MILLFFLGVMVAATCTGFLGIITLDYKHRIKRSNLPPQSLITEQEVWLVGILLAGIFLSVWLVNYSIAQIIHL
jgi:hypothetical protein